MENLYSECALVFVHSLVRSATKLLGLSLSDEKVPSSHVIFPGKSLAERDPFLHCALVSERSTFKMQNIQWKLNETPNLLHS